MNQEKKLKLVLASLKEKELIQYFQLYAEYYLVDLRKNIKKISFNCYESTLETRPLVINGYGKNPNEAYASGITNFLQKQFQDQSNHPNLRDALKKYSLVYNNPHSDIPSEKVKTQPDSYQKKLSLGKADLPPKTQSNTNKGESYLRPKDNIMKSVKTIKQQIFESLNHENINLRSSYQQEPTLNKNSSLAGLQQRATRNQQLASVNLKIKELQNKLSEALEENIFLKNRLKEKEKDQRAYGCQVKLERSCQQTKPVDKDNYLRDISSKLNNTTLTNDIAKEKARSYSLSNSANPSAFNSRNPVQRVKVPKLNLQILPNYHGKSNKSLNQSMLESYEKKTKAN